MKTDRQSSHSQCLQRPLVAISASWLKFGPPKTQNDPVLTVIIATFEKFIKKKVDKKKTPYDFKIGKCYDRRKMLPHHIF